jgi:hypothetical protein
MLFIDPAHNTDPLKPTCARCVHLVFYLTQTKYNPQGHFTMEDSEPVTHPFSQHTLAYKVPVTVPHLGKVERD